MPRNLYERVEVLFPLKDESLRQRICNEILPAYLADNLKARMLGSDGKYTYVRRGHNGKGFSVQEHLMRLAHEESNGSAKAREMAAKAAYTRSSEGAAPLPPAEPVEDVQDSSNATV